MSLNEEEISLSLNEVDLEINKFRLEANRYRQLFLNSETELIGAKLKKEALLETLRLLKIKKEGLD